MKNIQFIFVFLFLTLITFFLFKEPALSDHTCYTSCGNPSWFPSPLICSNGLCKNPSCLTQTDCSCDPYTVQGLRVLMPGNQIGIEPFRSAALSISPLGGTFNEENPAIHPRKAYYYNNLNGATSYIISVSAPLNSSVGYTACYNNTSCHNTTPTPGSSFIVNTNKVDSENFGPEDPYHYVDLWWHFTPPTPSIPSGVCGTYNPSTEKTPITWTWNPNTGAWVNGIGIQIKDSNENWYYNNTATSPFTINTISPGVQAMARSYNFNIFSNWATVVCPLPPPVFVYNGLIIDAEKNDESTTRGSYGYSGLRKTDDALAEKTLGSNSYNYILVGQQIDSRIQGTSNIGLSGVIFGSPSQTWTSTTSFINTVMANVRANKGFILLYANKSYFMTHSPIGINTIADYYYFYVPGSSGNYFWANKKQDSYLTVLINGEPIIKIKPRSPSICKSNYSNTTDDRARLPCFEVYFYQRLNNNVRNYGTYGYFFAEGVNNHFYTSDEEPITRYTPPTGDPLD